MKRLLCTAIVLALAGCSTVRDLHPANDGLKFEVRGKTYDEVWDAAVRIVAKDLQVMESTKSTGTLKAQKPPGMASWGEVVGVFIRPFVPGSASYTVEVQNIARSRFEAPSQNWEGTIIAQMKKELKQ